MLILDVLTPILFPKTKGWSVNPLSHIIILVKFYAKYDVSIGLLFAKIPNACTEAYDSVFMPHFIFLGEMIKDS